MGLDPLQEQIVRVAQSLPEAQSLALAGGGAMLAHGFVDRLTKDIDLFTDRDVAEALSVARGLRAALAAQGLEVRDGPVPPEHRMVVRDPASGRECAVDVFADAGRLHPRVALDVGPVLHPDDLAAAKDSGFTLSTWADALTALRRLTPADWARDGVEPPVADQCTDLFTRWRAAVLRDLQPPRPTGSPSPHPPHREPPAPSR
ncbi:MAG: nucleotidyl transferase AbiEii/AbiGii toxin family protein [Sporichthyaceae bacterium]